MCCSDISRSIVGFKKLPSTGEILIITKSRKDKICCNMLKYYSISTQAETNILDPKLVDNIRPRFKYVIVFFDNDDTGIKTVDKITLEYGFKSIIIPLEYKAKDLSELIGLRGEKEAKTILNNLINDAIK
jgi:hypothetical protein